MNTVTSILDRLFSGFGAHRAEILAVLCLLGPAACGTADTAGDTTGTLDTTDTVKPPASVPNCVVACSIPADCPPAGAAPIGDASHYSCSAGICEYLGCKSTSECAAVFGAEFVCAAVDGTPFKFCQTGCSTAADCVTPNAPDVMDENHYSCVGGACRYDGCKSDSECVSAYGAQYGCGPFASFAYKVCQLNCDTPADCSTPSAPAVVDASHFECKAGFCRYLGCESDAECKSGFSNPDVVCR